jgi:hypothetical protein
VARLRGQSRYGVLILDDEGRAVALAKVALLPQDRAALAHEAQALTTLAQFLRPPLRAPALRVAEDGLLLFDAVAWRPRRRPWHLSAAAASALGSFYKGDRTDTSCGGSHGDFAPWNVLEDDRGLVVIDWEDAQAMTDPFQDLCHYVVQGRSLLGRPVTGEILDGFRAGTGWIGEALAAYADAAARPVAEAESQLVAYLRRSTPRLPADVPWRVRRAREHLLHQLEVGAR